MQLSRLPVTDQSLPVSRHEIVDTDLYNYILTVDAKAWRRYLHALAVCPFCLSQVTPTGSCCQSFSEFRRSATAGKLYGQADVKYKDCKSTGKKFGITEETKGWKKEAKANRKTKDYLATRSV